MHTHIRRHATRLATWSSVAVLVEIAACTFDFGAFKAKPDAAWTAEDAPMESGGAQGSDAAPGAGGALGTGGTLGRDAAPDTGPVPDTVPILGTGGTLGRDAALGIGGALGTGGATTSTAVPGTGGVLSQTGGATTTAAGGEAGQSTQTPGSGGVPGTGGTTSTMACSGQPQFGICWYLGSSGASCQQTCAGHGQATSEAASLIGSSKQGGSLENCTTLLDLLGITMIPTAATRSDGRGVGCHISQSAAYWLSSPDFATNVSLSGYRVVCGCTR